MEIKISNISVKINGNLIFSNLSYIMNSGDMIALTGASGCGKTTLLNCLGLIQPIESGTILIDQRMPPNGMIRKLTFGINMLHLFIKIMVSSKMKVLLII